MQKKYRISSNNHSYILVTYYSTKYMNPISMWLFSDVKDEATETAAASSPARVFLRFVASAGLSPCAQAGEGLDLGGGWGTHPHHHHLVAVPRVHPQVKNQQNTQDNLLLSPAFPLLWVPQRCWDPSKTTCCSHTWEFPFATMVEVSAFSSKKQVRLLKTAVGM